MPLRQYLITCQFINHSICPKCQKNPTKYKFKIKLSTILWSSKQFKIYNKYNLYSQNQTLITIKHRINLTIKINKKTKLLSNSFKIILLALKHTKIPLFTQSRILNKTLVINKTKTFYNLLNNSNFSKLTRKIKIIIVQ